MSPLNKGNKTYPVLSYFIILLNLSYWLFQTMVNVENYLRKYHNVLEEDVGGLASRTLLPSLSNKILIIYTNKN